MDGVHLSLRGKRIFAQELAVLTEDFKLDFKREMDKTRLDRDKPGCGSKIVTGWCASKVHHSAASVELGDGGPCGSRGTRDIDGL